MPPPLRGGGIITGYNGAISYGVLTKVVSGYCGQCVEGLNKEKGISRIWMTIYNDF